MLSTEELKKIYVKILDMYPDADRVCWHIKSVIYLMQKLIEQSEKQD